MFQISKTTLALIIGAILITALAICVPALADIIAMLLAIPLILCGVGFSLAFIACFLPPVWIYVAWYLFKRKE